MSEIRSDEKAIKAVLASHSERTYTESELKLELAAKLREAADNCRVRAISENLMRDMARKRGEVSLAQAHSDRAAVLTEQQKAILALGDQSALEKHDAEVRADAIYRAFPPSAGGYISVIGAKAQFAAVMEKILRIIKARRNAIGGGGSDAANSMEINIGHPICDSLLDEIEPLIPSDWSAALIEYDAVAKLKILAEHLGNIIEAIRHWPESTGSPKLDAALQERVREGKLMAEHGIILDLLSIGQDVKIHTLEMLRDKFDKEIAALRATAGVQGEGI